MDDANAFEDRIAAEMLRRAGPVRTVDDVAIFSAITSRSPGRRFQPLFSWAKFVVAATIVALFGGVVVARVATERLGHESRSVGAAASPSPSLLPDDGDYLGGRRSLTVDGVPLSVILPEDSRTLSPSVTLMDDLYISFSTVRGQAAEAIILWTSFPDSVHARPCLLSPSAGSSVAELAEAVAMAPGVELVSGPSDVTVGGLAAQHVVISVAPDAASLGASQGRDRRDLGCSPAYFFGWEAADEGTIWLDTEPDDTIKVWIVEVDRKLLFIEAETKPDAGEAVEQEIEGDRRIDPLRVEGPADRHGSARGHACSGIEAACVSSDKSFP